MFYIFIRVPLFMRMIMYSEYINILVLASLPRMVREKHLRVMIMMIITILLLVLWYKKYVMLIPGAGVPGCETVPYKSIL